MIVVRRVIGLIGLAMLGLGFYALIETANQYINGTSLSFTTVFDLCAELGLAPFIPTAVMDNVGQLPAFFLLSIAGIILCWWGLKSLAPKPKFRKA